MVKEIHAGLQEVRPGRTLFVREWIFGGKDDDQSQDVVVDLQMVVVHGSCATEAQFHPLCQSLAQQPGKRIKCILYDMLGCGQSPVIYDWNAYAKDELEQDLGAIVETYTQPDLPLYFCSHSYGPNLLLSWLNKMNGNNNNNNALQRQIEGFIFLGSTIRLGDSKPYPDGGHPIFQLPLFLLKCLQSSMTKDFVERGVEKSHQELRQACLNSSNANDMYMVQAFYRQTKWITANEFRQALQNVKLLALHGVADGIITIEWGQAMVNQLMEVNETNHNNVKFVPIEKASHLVMVEQPDEVAQHVQQFLNE